MKKIIFFLTILLCSCGPDPNEGLKPGDFGYRFKYFTYLNDSIVIYHNAVGSPIININTGKVINYASESTGRLKVKGDDNTVTIK